MHIGNKLRHIKDLAIKSNKRHALLLMAKTLLNLPIPGLDPPMQLDSKPIDPRKLPYGLGLLQRMDSLDINVVGGAILLGCVKSG